MIAMIWDLLVYHFGKGGGEGLTQFQNQLDAVERPTPRDRIGSGKISPMTTQATGPQVEANMLMFMQINAIIADVADLLFGSVPWVLPAVTPTMPTMYWEMTIPVPPKMRRLRRPTRSTR